MGYLKDKHGALIDGENLVGYDADRAQRLSEQLGRMLVSGR